MNKFLVILCDTEGVPDYIHPSEIFGVDKNEVSQIIQQDTPAQYIKGIYTPQEYLAYIETDQFRTQIFSFYPQLGQNPKNFQNFVNNIKNNIFLSEETNNPQNLLELSNQTNNQIIANDLVNRQNIPMSSNDLVNRQNIQPRVNQCVTNNAPPPIKYFNDGNVQFKLEQGQLYKKIWEDVNLESYTNQKGELVYPEVRLISKETNKPVKSTKYGIQKLVWKKID